MTEPAVPAEPAEPSEPDEAPTAAAARFLNLVHAGNHAAVAGFIYSPLRAAWRAVDPAWATRAADVVRVCLDEDWDRLLILPVERQWRVVPTAGEPALALLADRNRATN